MRSRGDLKLTMLKGIQVKMRWYDEDVLEVGIAAWNGAFGGEANVYVPIGGLTDAAEKLSGFPSNPADKREVVFGQFGPVWAGGAVGKRFYCSDGAGHACVESKIESEGQVAGVTQSAVLSFFIEPSALDAFLKELRRLEAEKKGTASLRAI